MLHTRISAEYRAELEAWRRQRLAELQDENGWLNLAGLYWLQEGRNSIGSAAGNDIVFACEGVAARLCTLILHNGQVSFRAARNTQIRINGMPATTMQLRSDAGGTPDILEHDSLRWHIIKRGERYGIRLRNLKHNTAAEFAGIDYYPIVPEWRITARFETYTSPKVLNIPTILGTVEEQECSGALVFSIAGKDYRLESGSTPENGFFLVFSDASSAGESYPGGRFLWADPPDSAGNVVLDFNKAYNPPCAFTPYATCPLPPKGNILPLNIPAGEKKYSADH